MNVLKYAKCSTECCKFGNSSGYTCDNGCICKSDVLPLNGLAIDDNIHYKPYENIVHDNFSLNSINPNTTDLQLKS